jgi:hypothetical protein
MKKKHHKNTSVSLLLLVLIVSAFAGCSANLPQANNTSIKANQPVSNTNLQSNQPEKSAAGFINKVWKVNKSNSIAAGQIYVFISDGTLAMTSPNGKPAFGSWTYKDGNLTMVEEGIPYKVDILKLSKDEFNIKINDPGKGVEIEFVPATESEVTR